MLTAKSASKLNRLIFVQMKAMRGNLRMAHGPSHSVLVWLDLGQGFTSTNSEYIFYAEQSKADAMEDIRKYVNDCGTIVYLQQEAGVK